MSNTIRRKHHVYNYYRWVLRDYAFGGMPTKCVSKKSSEGRKRLAVYHSDAGFGDYGHASPPHWYRRYMNKRMSYKEKQVVKRALKSDFEATLEKRVRNASWYW